MMEYLIRRAKPGDEAALAHVQTESWKAAFQGILPADALQAATQLDRVTAMYRRILEQNYGYLYLLTVDGNPHGIAAWGATRSEDMPGYAELICIHSLPGNWRKGFGSKLMSTVLQDMKEAGYKKVMLWVFEENSRARQFYEACGFTTAGKVKPDFEPTELCYEKEL